MIREIAPRQPVKRRAGELVAALLFVLLCISTIATVSATYLLLGSADTLAIRMPTRSVVYLHADGPTAVRSLSAFAPTPIPDIRPTEIAFYATMDDSRKLHWHTLVTWRWPYIPSEDERKSLNMVRATFLDERTARLGGDLSEETAFGTSHEVSNALANARSRSRMQAFVDIGSLSSSLPTESQALPSLFVAGITMTNTRAITRVVALGAYQDHQGFDLDTFTILFGAMPNENDPSIYRAAMNAAKFLDTHTKTIDINDAGTTDATASLLLGNTSIQQTITALAPYSGLRWPNRVDIHLPDGERATELLLTPEGSATIQTSPESKDLRNIVQIGNNVSISKENNESWGALRNCGQDSSPILTLDFAHNEKLKDQLYWLPYKSIAINLEGNQTAVICGYN